MVPLLRFSRMLLVNDLAQIAVPVAVEGRLHIS
jgi:hypothetical protein